MIDPPSTSTTLLADLAADSRHVRWTEFVARYRPMMSAYLAARFPALDAEEVVAETLVALVEVMKDYRYDPQETGRFHNYLTGVLRHKALRQCREEDRRSAVMRGFAQEPTAAADTRAAEQEQEADAARQAMVEIALARFFADETIRPLTKRIFEAVAVRGESPEEVAKTYAVDRHAVDQIKSRSLARLRTYVGELEKLYE